MQPSEFCTKSGDLRLKVVIKQHLVQKWVKGSFLEQVPFYLRDYKEEAHLYLECNPSTLAQKYGITFNNFMYGYVKDPSLSEQSRLSKSRHTGRISLIVM